jgi:hypothetical protein
VYDADERVGVAAVRSGSAIARFLGTSSPNTIDSAVTRINASAVAVPPAAVSAMPSATRLGTNRIAIAGSAR